MAADATTWTDRPNRLPWPPIIYGVLAVIAFAAGRLYPFGTVAAIGRTAPILGAAAMIAGIILDGAAMLWMRRCHANILPHRAATALVTTGPFALSRNPIYLGNTALLAGAGLAFDNAWFLVAAACAVPLVSMLAIRREERHMAARFGDAWRAYAGRTPRWLRLWP